MDRKDTVGKVSDRAAALAEKVREAKLDERAAELAAQARERVREARLEERAAEIAATAREKLREADLETKAAAAVAGAGAIAAQAADSTRDVTDRTFKRVGERLSDTSAGERLAGTAVGDKLGLDTDKRRPWWLLILVAVAVAVGFKVVSQRRQEEAEFDWEVGEPIGQVNGEASTTPSAAPGTSLPLESRVREALGQDPRTSTLPRLNVNVVEGTVFVRGAVDAAVDQEALKSVIQGVEGVTDVDLQVTVTSS